MSKIGKKPIEVPEGVDIKILEDKIEIKGPNATLEVPVLEGVKAESKDGHLEFAPVDKLKQTLSNWGTQRSLAQNAIDGVRQDFAKSLVIEGVGYRANMEGGTLVMSLGFSHPVKFESPEGIKIEVEDNTIKVSGSDKARVGQAAAKIRSFKKPEPYKGKGIRYDDEVVRRKAGKKAVGTT